MGKKFAYPNMTSSELQAVEELTNNKSITITQADKGGAVVVWDTELYIQEAERQLSDQAIYKRLDRDPVGEIKNRIKQLVGEAKQGGCIDEELAIFLLVGHPKTPLLYLLPKIHKSVVNPPGRPIVSGRDSVLNNISIFLDKILRRYAIETKSYICDKSDFLLKISELIVPDSAILASFDIVSLYTSINHHRGLEALRLALDKPDISPMGKDFILQLLNINLTCNYFAFGGSYYIQAQGTTRIPKLH